MSESLILARILNGNAEITLSSMTAMRKPGLGKELAVVVAIKLVVIALLWWGFVRDQRVEVRAEDIAASPSDAQLHTNRENKTHAQ